MICYICQQSKVVSRLNVGPQPISNRFLTKTLENEYLHPLNLGICEVCGLAQLINPAPAEEVRPKYNWIRYNEPEGHLDDLVENLFKLNLVSAKSSILGLTDKEDSSLARLNRKGIKSTTRLTLEDLQITDANVGIETIQQSITEEFSQSWINKNGPVDVIFARHILEHTHEPLRFIKSLKMLLKPNGHIIFEVPDNTKVFNANDYSILWEEHIVYFTPATFLNSLNLLGFDVVFFKNYNYSMENSLIAIVRDKIHANSALSSEALETGKKIATDYCRNFAESKKRTHTILEKLYAQGPIALLGAGHLAVHFINLMEIEKYIKFVVDDHPNKCGLFMPGSHLAILPSEELLKQNIKFCLMSVSHESEIKVLNSKKEFIANGGQFYSIFPTSRYPLKDNYEMV